MSARDPNGREDRTDTGPDDATQLQPDQRFDRVEDAAEQFQYTDPTAEDFRDTLGGVTPREDLLRREGVGMYADEFEQVDLQQSDIAVEDGEIRPTESVLDREERARRRAAEREAERAAAADIADQIESETGEDVNPSQIDVAGEDVEYSGAAAEAYDTYQRTIGAQQLDEEVDQDVGPGDVLLDDGSVDLDPASDVGQELALESIEEQYVESAVQDIPRGKGGGMSSPAAGSPTDFIAEDAQAELDTADLSIDDVQVDEGDTTLAAEAQTRIAAADLDVDPERLEAVDDGFAVDPGPVDPATDPTMNRYAAGVPGAPSEPVDALAGPPTLAERQSIRDIDAVQADVAAELDGQVDRQDIVLGQDGPTLTESGRLDLAADESGIDRDRLAVDEETDEITVAEEEPSGILERGEAFTLGLIDEGEERLREADPVSGLVDAGADFLTTPPLLDEQASATVRESAQTVAPELGSQVAEELEGQAEPRAEEVLDAAGAIEGRGIDALPEPLETVAEDQRPTDQIRDELGGGGIDVPGVVSPAPTSLDEADRMFAATPSTTARWLEPFGFGILARDTAEFVAEDYEADLERSEEVAGDILETPRDTTVRDLADLSAPIVPMAQTTPARSERRREQLASAGAAALAGGGSLVDAYESDPRGTGARAAGALGSFVAAPFAGRGLARTARGGARRARSRVDDLDIEPRIREQLEDAGIEPFGPSLAQRELTIERAADEATARLEGDMYQAELESAAPQIERFDDPVEQVRAYRDMFPTEEAFQAELARAQQQTQTQTQALAISDAATALPGAEALESEMFVEPDTATDQTLESPTMAVPDRQMEAEIFAEPTDTTTRTTTGVAEDLATTQQQTTGLQTDLGLQQELGALSTTTAAGQTEALATQLGVETQAQQEATRARAMQLRQPRRTETRPPRTMLPDPDPDPDPGEPLFGFDQSDAAFDTGIATPSEVVDSWTDTDITGDGFTSPNTQGAEAQDGLAEEWFDDAPTWEDE